MGQTRHRGPSVACPVLPIYFQVIVSEGVYDTIPDTGEVRKIPREESIEYIMNWVRENVEGYYLRAEDSPFDCHLIEADLFKELYAIKPPESLGAIFQRVIPK